MKCIRIHDITYEKLREKSKKDRRSILATLDIIVESYMEEQNVQNKKKKMD